MGLAAEHFTEHRRTLFGIAYRMLGSAAEAEDVLQDAYLRAASAKEPPDAPGPWLAVIVTRLCLDVLRSARARREAYVGTWLPEPVLTAEVLDIDPAPSGLHAGSLHAPSPPGARLDAAESVSMALLVLLETLSPLERAALVLRDVFDWEFDAIATALERSPATCRQLVHRARQHLAARQPRFRATEAEQQRLFHAFLQALAAGDAEALAPLLAADVVAMSDGGGKARAALRDITGRDRVSRFLAGTARKGAAEGFAVTLASLNGGPAFLGHLGGQLVVALGFEVTPEGASLVWMMRNPDKLSRLHERLAAAAASP
ncbi:RNA polymerase sigma factor SigJ [Chondromyces apiculatus]|uniref:RNA polymerase sigma-70 factor n=1 Tax=Chondromyces apiculatus DSM 436 TaxID=1192034 RepID=A0A017TGD5_9BACT|nr:RNA polymerase sigma factor SigJ [Chondromyces apiculatus]EYF07641.1 RNA polymerase sigma-70 factor [Chondromyces apiculatus DSM 436]